MTSNEKRHHRGKGTTAAVQTRNLPQCCAAKE
jgi:hypothetical protein